MRLSRIAARLALSSTQNVPVERSSRARPNTFARPAQAGEKVVAVGFENVFFEDRAGRDDPRDLAADDAVRGRGVLHLVADGDLLAGLDQLGEIEVDGVIRHAAHGHASGASSARCRGSATPLSRRRRTSRRSRRAGKTGLYPGETSPRIRRYCPIIGVVWSVIRAPKKLRAKTVGVVTTAGSRNV